MQNKNRVIFTVVILLLAFFVGGYYYKNMNNKNVTKISKEKMALLQRPTSLVIGNKDAKIQLVEFFDPACGSCAYYHPKVKKLLEEKKDDIKLVVRYAPFHKNSNYAVKMLEGAREQALFEQTLTFMFNTQSKWVENHTVNPQKLWRLLSNVKGLDMEKLGVFMNSNKADKIIEQDILDGEKLEVHQTPSFFVNGQPLIDFGWDNLLKLIDSNL